jgi:hypothetical protein
VIPRKNYCHLLATKCIIDRFDRVRYEYNPVQLHWHPCGLNNRWNWNMTSTCSSSRLAAVTVAIAEIYAETTATP